MKEHSKYYILIACLGLGLSSAPAIAELKALEDDFLSGVSGQSGITIDVQKNSSIAEIAYFDDGNGIALQGVRLSAADDPNGFSEHRYIFDILADGSLAIEFSSNHKSRFEIEEIRFIDTPGIPSVANTPSIGGFFFDYISNGSLRVANVGNGGQGPHGTMGGVYDIDVDITEGRLGYRTNGNELFFDGMDLSINSVGTILGVTPTGLLNLELPNFLLEMSVDAIRYSNNPNNHGVTNDVDSGAELASFGSLWANLDMSASLLIAAGGADGVEGMTLDANATINRLDVAWGDDTDWADTGYWVGALGMTGAINIDNLYIDVMDDEDAGVTPAKDYGLGLSLAFDRLEANIQIADIVLGETKTNIDAYVANNATPIKTIGGVELNLLLADGTYDSTPLTNKVLVQAGGNVDAGYQGLRLDTQLSVISPNNESNFVYTDDGNSVMLSRFEAFADGDVTVDVTAQGSNNGTEFFDGLRVGFEDFAFGYRVEGYRVAKSTGDSNDLKNADAQDAYAVPGLSGGLLGLGGYPSVEGVLNGHATIGPGGNVGQEGITINSDLTLSDGDLSVFMNSDGTGKGLWLSGLNYDVHLRDLMLDATDEGLKIYEGERWSTLDVTDFKVGGKESGASFGRVIVERYELGSEKTISAGGAGAVCIGGSGADQTACGLDGGRWEDRGSEGITISTIRRLAPENEIDGKRNRFTWETGRTGEGTAPVNGSGMQLIFDNFTTNDGDGLTDSYGLRTDYNIDVAGTRVVKKENGLDSNGVDGSKGDIKVMNADGTYRYVSPGALTPEDIANSPVGLAVRTRTHFKELDFDQVNLAHPVGGESTLLYGMKLQNFDITTDITTTTLD